MTPAARIYVTAVTGMGLLFLLGSFFLNGRAPDWPRFLAYLGLVLVASALKVRLPGMQGTISLNFLVYLVAVARMSLSEALLLALAGTVVQTTWRTRRPATPVQVIFNVAAVMTSLAGAFLLSRIWGPEPGLPALAFAAVVFYGLNTALVSEVIALVQQKRFASVLNVFICGPCRIT